MDSKIFVVIAVLCLSACNDKYKQTLAEEGDQLSVSITLDSLPDSITYNKSTTPDDMVEYEWGVVFDITGDGVINKGDIALRILHFKSPGSVERAGTISDLDPALWVYTTDTENTKGVGLKSEVSGNTITLSVSKNAHPSLQMITESTLVNFETATYDTTIPQIKHDYHPSFSTLLSIPAGGSFTDPQGDTQVPYIDMVSMKISL